MSNKKRPYKVVNIQTNAEVMVVAISQAQAISFIARSMFAADAASAMEVVGHVSAGGGVYDATVEGAEPALPPPPAAPAPPAADEYLEDGIGARLDDADVPDGQSEPGDDADDWQQHIQGGLAARAGVAD